VGKAKRNHGVWSIARLMPSTTKWWVLPTGEGHEDLDDLIKRIDENHGGKIFYKRGSWSPYNANRE